MRVYTDQFNIHCYILIDIYIYISDLLIVSCMNQIYIYIDQYLYIYLFIRDQSRSVFALLAEAFTS